MKNSIYSHRVFVKIRLVKKIMIKVLTKTGRKVKILSKMTGRINSVKVNFTLHNTPKTLKRASMHFFEC